MTNQTTFDFDDGISDYEVEAVVLFDSKTKRESGYGLDADGRNDVDSFFTETEILDILVDGKSVLNDFYGTPNFDLALKAVDREVEKCEY